MKYSVEELENSILKKYDKSIRFSESDNKMLLEFNIKDIDVKEGSNYDEVTSVCKVKDRFFKLTWTKGRRIGIDYYINQPMEVVEEKKIEEVTYYVDK
jgi:hypothetical protein